MDESILDSVKLGLGIAPDYPYFDSQLILYINSALATLVQTGVGAEGFTIQDNAATWSSFIGDKMAALEYSKSYVIKKVQLLFDPPQSSGAMQALKELIAEYEWRGYIECDHLELDEEAEGD